ncbi:V-type proton ATPase subunit S1 [Rhagoletis pomonella]|uniref:V-type proton ATPase subunit S1 n=1 Tax=Rhagoletis pomonella TaxID=28610 RepID=UPI00177E0241|nr:V-type proton ATPase subunit S1 [Rhagoletis pomonella]
MKFVFLTLFIIGVAAAAKYNTVLLGGAQSTTPSALSKVTSEEFYSILKPLAENNQIVVFQEPGLSFHDFLCKKNGTESQSCYAHLSSITPKTFYAKGDLSDKVLASIDPNYVVISIPKDGNLETPLKCEAHKVYIFQFSEETELSREDTLEAHDFIIQKIIKQLSCPTILLYTATPVEETSVNKRSRRAVSVWETAAPEGGTIFADTKFQIFYTKLAVKIGTAAAKEITISSMSIQERNTTDFTVTLASSDATDTITFDIELVKGYYYMKQLTYNTNTQFRTTDINAPPAFSYYCGNLTVYSNSGDSLLWNSVQFQAPFGSKVTAVGDKYFEFGDSWNCVGFVTHAILAGLFVSLILLAILFVGICWMMDINTMDRFDDPKGKTITINANE